MKTRRAFMSAIAVVAVLLGLGFGSGTASAETVAGVPDSGQWCYDWAQANSNDVVGVEVNFIGTVGSAAQNNAKCRFIYAYGVSEQVAGRWYGWNGVMPETQLPVNWDAACKAQYPGSYVKWYDPKYPPMADISYGNTLAAQGHNWVCVY